MQLSAYSFKGGTGRARHRQQQMLPMMIFGVTALGMVMVPIGFQFLALIAGKALLLSKMALLLASINGIKRVIYLFVTSKQIKLFKNNSISPTFFSTPKTHTHQHFDSISFGFNVFIGRL
jgi:hypothetical protein